MDLLYMVGLCILLWPCAWLWQTLIRPIRVLCANITVPSKRHTLAATLAYRLQNLTFGAIFSLSLCLCLSVSPTNMRNC